MSAPRQGVLNRIHAKAHRTSQDRFRPFRRLWSLGNASRCVLRCGSSRQRDDSSPAFGVERGPPFPYFGRFGTDGGGGFPDEFAAVNISGMDVSAFPVDFPVRPLPRQHVPPTAPAVPIPPVVVNRLEFAGADGLEPLGDVRGISGGSATSRSTRRPAHFFNSSILSAPAPRRG